jgi:hypothetical protein
MTRGGAPQLAAEDLHVIGANDGKLWHTIRFSTPGGPWQAFVDVKAEAGNVGDFVDVDCAREAGGPDDTQGILHVVGVTGDGGCGTRSGRRAATIAGGPSPTSHSTPKESGPSSGPPSRPLVRPIGSRWWSRA